MSGSCDAQLLPLVRLGPEWRSRRHGHPPRRRSLSKRATMNDARGLLNLACDLIARFEGTAVQESKVFSDDDEYTGLKLKFGMQTA